MHLFQVWLLARVGRRLRKSLGHEGCDAYSPTDLQMKKREGDHEGELNQIELKLI